MLVLASASPRRQELLRNAGSLSKCSPRISPKTRCLENPRRTARNAWRVTSARGCASTSTSCRARADTVVVVDGTLLGKPSDAADAARMLRLLSGREHQVITGVCLVVSGQWSVAVKPWQSNHFCNDDRDYGKEIADYVASGEPMDKAGAYAIQGIASAGFLASKGITATWSDCR